MTGAAPTSLASAAEQHVTAVGIVPEDKVHWVDSYGKAITRPDETRLEEDPHACLMSQLHLAGRPASGQEVNVDQSQPYPRAHQSVHREATNLNLAAAQATQPITW